MSDGDDFVVREEAPRKYFWMTPNIVDDIKISTQAFRIYSHYKRIVGEKGGPVREGVRTTARLCNVSKNKIGEYQRELRDCGLVKLVPSPRSAEPPEVVLLDIWQRNIEYFDVEPKLLSDPVSHLRDSRVRNKGHEPSPEWDSIEEREEHKENGGRQAPTDRARKRIRPEEIGPKKQDEMLAREFFENDDLAEDLWPFVEHAAKQNNDGHIAASRIMRAFVTPVVELRTKTSQAALRYGLSEALRLGKWDLRYALAVARNNPQGAPPEKILANPAKGVGTNMTQETPIAAFSAIQTHERLGRYSRLAQAFDFTSEDHPPWQIYNNLGGDEQERWRNLQSLRSVSKRAMRETNGDD